MHLDKYYITRLLQLNSSAANLVKGGSGCLYSSAKTAKDVHGTNPGSLGGGELYRGKNILKFSRASKILIKEMSMKKFMFILVALVAVTFVAAGAAMATVVGGKHDLSSSGGGAFTSDTNEVCVFCHTPHNAKAQSVVKLLWNRSYVPSGTWTPYGTTRRNTQTANATALEASTKLCLSCHDGTAAMNALLNAPGATTTMPAGSVENNITGATLDGLDFSNDHPVGVLYNEGSSYGLNNLSGVADTAGTVRVNADGTLAGLSATDKVECVTCHDVHSNTDLFVALPGGNTNSQLCLACHIK